MKFDCVIMNPPYQDANNKRSPLWQKFVENSFNTVKLGGFIVAVHPCAWRKPNHSLLDGFQKKQLKYLEIHDQQDGQKTFGCGTRYDWYILCNRPNDGKTVIVDQKQKQETQDISSCAFIPHEHSAILKKCLASNGEEQAKIIHSFSMYGNDKPWMSKEKDDKFLYPCIYSTPCGKTPVLLYSSKKDGHFGVKKVILGKASPENCFYDEKGEYGVTNNCFAIQVDSDEEAQGIISALSSNGFKKIIDICKWAGFAIQYEIFLSFKKDFWKEF